MVRPVASRRWLALIGAVVALLAGTAVALRGEPDEHRLGVFTTLPLLWSEAPDVAAILNSPERPHWARAELARYGTIEPLDTLANLSGVDRLIMAQPRPLSAEENVALDAWVRGGGKLILFADPMLTEDSAYPLGDRRRPQDVVLLSPILTRWGLELLFDEEQAFEEGPLEVLGKEMAVNMPGRLVITDSHHCRGWNEGRVATCAIGKGRVVVLADAAVLERDNQGGERSAALRFLLDSAFVGR